MPLKRLPKDADNALVVEALVAALDNLVEIPEYDGDPKTSRRRLRIKNAARRLVRQYRSKNP